MSVELGPGLIGSIYDGIQRPLDAIMEKTGGNLLNRGVEVPSLKREKKWTFVPAANAGDKVGGEMCIRDSLLFSFFIAKFLRVEMMAEDDQGQISITAEVKPGMTIDKVDNIMKQIEDIISQQGDVESYITLAGSSGLSMSSDPNITVYLKKDRKMETDEVVRLWKQQLGGISDTNIDVYKRQPGPFP